VTASTDPSEARAEPPWAPEISWLQPYPDSYLVAPHEAEPEAQAVARETIELVFLAALQHLPPRQRAILILRDVLDWSARETAAVLDVSVAAINSAHQRARATLRALPQVSQTGPWPREAATAQERATLQTFMDAWERADTDQLTTLLCEEARWAMPPAPLWFDGRAAIARLFELFPIDWRGRAFRLLPTAANRQPAAAAYLRQPGESVFHLTARHVLRIEAGLIAEITTFAPELCHGFALPPTLDR
jgi:RNA polymerase sigma-70 factor (ECF subfamily)